MKRRPSLCDVPARPKLSTNPRGSRSNDDSIDTRVRCARISRMSGRCCKRGDCVWRGAAWLIQRHARCRKYCSDVILINRGRSAQRDGEVGAGVVEIRSGCGRRTGGRVIFLCGDECVHTHTHTHSWARCTLTLLSVSPTPLIRSNPSGRCSRPSASKLARWMAAAPSVFSGALCRFSCLHPSLISRRRWETGWIDEPKDKPFRIRSMMNIKFNHLSTMVAPDNNGIFF